MMKKIFTLLMLACFGLTVASASTATYYVSSTGNDISNDGLTPETPFKTILKATAVVADNTPTTIHLEANTTFDITRPDTIKIRKNKMVTMVGKNTTIQAHAEPGKGGRILFIDVDTEVTIKGVIFKNGCTRDGVPGGAIFFEGNSLTIDSCSFITNEGNSSGGAIGSRGKDLIITNSVFDGNRVFGGYGYGGVIYHCGLPNGGEPGSLIIRNTSFTSNEGKADTKGDVISFVHAYRASVDPRGLNNQPYSNINYFELVNCLFKDNSNPGSNLSPGAADISFIGTLNIEANIVNNTFYNSRTLALPFTLEPIRLINNVFYSGSNTADKFNYAIAAANDRDPIIGYNNVIVGKLGYGVQVIDDPCFTTKKEEFNNQIFKDISAISKLGLSTRSNKDHFVYCLPIESTGSILIDKGINSFVVNNREIVPVADIHGTPISGLAKDIGSFEMATTSVDKTQSERSDLFSMIHQDDNLVIKNNTGHSQVLTIRLVDGRVVYSAPLEQELTISKSILSIPNGILIISVANGTVTQTVKTIFF